MNATELSQITIEPEDYSAELEARLQELVDKDPAPRLRTELTVTIGRFVHPLGIHTWVHWKQYDKTTGRVIDMPGEVCAWCSAGKLR